MNRLWLSSFFVKNEHTPSSSLYSGATAFLILTTFASSSLLTLPCIILPSIPLHLRLLNSSASSHLIPVHESVLVLGYQSNLHRSSPNMIVLDVKWRRDKYKTCIFVWMQVERICGISRKICITLVSHRRRRTNARKRDRRETRRSRERHSEKQEQRKGNDGYQSTICYDTISAMVKHSIGGREM